MTDSIARRIVSGAALTAAAFLLVIFLSHGSVVVHIAAVLLAAAAVALAWLFSQSLTRRIGALTMLVDTMLDEAGTHPPLLHRDDELGELTRSVERMIPKVADLVSRLSMELTRREAVLASMTEAVLAVDAQLNVTFCNHSFQKAVGDHGAAQGTPLIRMVRDPDLFRVLKQVVDSGAPVHRRVQLSGRSFDVNAALLANSTSRGAIAILHDVSAEEHLERVKRDFIANVSHEFRTPLATIRGYAETLLDGGLEDKKNRRKFVEIIQANGIRLNNIAADLLTLSDLEAGRPEPEPGPIPVSDAIMSAVRAVEPAARLRGVTLRVDEVPGVAILGYGIRFEQAVLNLLDNAVKFNHENGEAGVQVERRPEGRVEVVVWDTGIGIPAADQARVFERFYRVDKARSRQVGGTGLGLSIVKHAVEQMNGTIAVASTPGQGSRFTITLPEHISR